MGEPPSDSGGSQDTVQPNLVTFPTMTLRGASGTSKPWHRRQEASNRGHVVTAFNNLNKGAFLTKLVLGLYRLMGFDIGSAANSVSGTDSEQVQGILLEAGHSVLRTLSVVGGQSPRLTLHVTSLHHVAHHLAAAVTLRLLPHQAYLTVCGVNHLQVLHRPRNIWKRTTPSR